MSLDCDSIFMEIALKEAKESFERGDFPVGAVLTFDGKLIGKANNSNRTNQDWNSHAEAQLIRHYSSAIQKQVKENRGRVELYTTLEPCLMCLGTSHLNRIGRIIYACPDPNGGATDVNVSSLPEWYSRKWPKTETGPFRNESYGLLVTHMRKYKSWENVLRLFEEMRNSW